MFSRMNRIYIGTSGWVYKGWADDFYRGLRQREHFHHYTTQFPTVEINATFYRLPSLKAVHDWATQAPEGFQFAVKGSRFITHMKRLNNLQNSLNRFIRRIKPLQPRIGPLLWQLPPNLKKDLPRLENFLRRLPDYFSHAVEFRDASWLTPDTFELLRNHNAAFVSVSSLRMPFDLTVTADFVYVRFHGLAGGAYHDYTRDELAPWAAHLLGNAQAGRNCYAYFNNDLNVRAPHNAKLLMELCGDLAVPPLAGQADG